MRVKELENEKCKNCKHWEETKDPEDWGECYKIILCNMAYSNDSYISTYKDFSCICWEEKSE